MRRRRCCPALLLLSLISILPVAAVDPSLACLAPGESLYSVALPWHQPLAAGAPLGSPPPLACLRVPARAGGYEVKLSVPVATPAILSLAVAASAEGGGASVSAEDERLLFRVAASASGGFSLVPDGAAGAGGSAGADDAAVTLWLFARASPLGAAAAGAARRGLAVDVSLDSTTLGLPDRVLRRAPVLLALVLVATGAGAAALARLLAAAERLGADAPAKVGAAPPRRRRKAE